MIIKIIKIIKIIDNQQYRRHRYLSKNKLSIRRKTINETNTIRYRILKNKIRIESIIKIKVNKTIISLNVFYNRTSMQAIVIDDFINLLIFISTTKLLSKKINILSRNLKKKKKFKRRVL